MTDRGKKIGSKPGQVDYLLSGKKEVLQGKLCNVSEIFGALAIAENKAVGHVIIVTKAPTPVVQKKHIDKDVKYNLCEDEEEEYNGRVTTSMKWGEFDPDCTVVSSGSFA